MSDRIIIHHGRQPPRPAEEQLPRAEEQSPRERKRAEEQVPEERKRVVHRHRQSCLTTAIGWGAVLVAVMVLLGIAGVITLLYGERFYTGRIYPHISIHGFDVGFYHTTSARTALEQHYAAFLENPITLVYGDRTWKPTAAQLGVQLDFDAALREAVALGRADTHINSAREVAAIWEQGMEVPLPVIIDQQAMQRYLLKVAQEIEAAPRNADVVLDGPEVIIEPEQFGLQVLVDPTLRDMTAALQYLDPQEVPLRTRTLIPPMRTSDVQGFAAEAQAVFAAPIVLNSISSKCPDCHWEWPLDQLAQWVHINRTPMQDGRVDLKLVIDQAAIQRELVPIAVAMHRNGGLPRVDWNYGNLTIIEPGTSGEGLDANLTLALINAALQKGGPRTLDLPLTAIPPPVVASNLASLGITDLLGAGVSSFRASQAYRITNIRAGAWRMHGILIPPGESFSFNDALGAVDASNGFVQGAAIVQNRTQMEWGGGLCQVSTTMFRSAFWAGLPIIERHEHKFRINWYEELGEPPGFDATIFTGAADLRFVNDTGGWLLTQAWVNLNKQQLTIAIYGRPTGREVTIGSQVLSQTPAPSNALYLDDPSMRIGTFKQTDWSRPGMTAAIYRNVWQSGQLIHQDTFLSVFEPWPNIYMRGTGRW